MSERPMTDAECVAQARILIARAAKGVEQLENVAGQAFCRLTALAGMLARLEDLARSRHPDAVDAALLDAATVCREAEVLLRYVESRKREPLPAATDRRPRTHPRVVDYPSRARSAAE